jgi:Tfp pilus assembly protein PilX
MRTHRRPAGQAGSALVVSLIMLTLLTLFVLSAINSGTINLRVAGNTQSQDEARGAGQQAIEQFVSSYANFFPAPASQAGTGYDVNNDGTADYSVSIATPTCRRASQQIPARSVDCANGLKSTPPLVCWDTLWDVTATATDAKTGTQQVITQGVSITFPPTFTPASVGC